MANKILITDGEGTLGQALISQGAGVAPIFAAALVFNVKDYGAVGDDSTNDTSAIQAAVDAAGAVGGVVWFPAGTYRMQTNPLKLYTGSTPYVGITIAGAGADKAIIKQMTTGVDIIQGLNNTTGAVQLYNATVKDLTLVFGGTASNSGNGIYLKQNAAGGPSFQGMTFENLNINQIGGSGKYGFNAESLIVSSLRNVMVVNSANGFYLNGGAFGGYDSINTSVNFFNCYANGITGGIGFNIKKTQYTSLHSCAADANATTAYLVDTCTGLSFVACGSEWATGSSATSYKVTSSTAISIEGGYMYQASGTNTNLVWVTGNSTGVTIKNLGCYLESGTLTNGILVDAGSQVTDIDNVFGAGGGAITNMRNINASAIFNQISTAGKLGITTIELGNISDTTISRVSAGVIAVEGVTVPTISSTSTLTNKTLTSPAITAPTITGAMTYVKAAGTVSALSTLGATETIDWATGTHFTGTLDSDVTISFSNAVAGQVIDIKLIYSGAQRTITWPTVTWMDGADGSAPVAPITTGDILIVSVYWDGTDYILTSTGNYALYA